PTRGLLNASIPPTHELPIAPIACAGRHDVPERTQHNRPVVFEEFEQHIASTRVPGELERHVEFVQGVLLAAQRAKGPRKVRARYDLVVFGASRLQSAQALTDRRNRSAGIP